MSLMMDVLNKTMCVTIIFLGMTTNAAAATINLDFDAEIYILDDPTNIIGNELGLSLNIGDVFNTGYILDSNATVTYSGGDGVTSAFYNVDPVTTYMNFNGASLVATSPSAANGFIGDNYDELGDGQIADVWRILAELPPTGSQPEILIGIILFDETATKHDSLLPYLNDSLVGWDNALSYIIADNNIIMLANITQVPLPAAFWLFGSGIIGLIGVARKKKV